MESLYGSFTQTDYDNLMLEYHSLMNEQIEKGIDHSERLAKLHKILWEDEDMSFEDLAKFNKRETMIILAQSKETDGHAIYSNSFFVGMTKQEYYLHVKPIFDKFSDRHHTALEENIDREFEKWLRREKEIQDIYDFHKVFEVYVCVKKDLSNGFLASPFYPVSGHWGAYSPWERYPNHVELNSIKDVENMPFYDWEKKEYLPIDFGKRNEK